MDDLLLAGDIGGTKANLVLVDPAGDPRRPLFAARLPTAGHASLEALLDAFLSQASGRRPRRVCLGIPSPVVDGRVRPVNIPWEAQETAIANHLGADHVRFLNDLVATALGIPELTDDELITLQPGTRRSAGAIAVIAPGTGLGAGFLVHDGGRYRAHPSEGGHADFAPRGERQRRLHAFLADAGGQVSLEAVCSGRGITNLWRFFGAEGLRDEPDIESRAAAAADPVPLVMTAAEDPARNPRAAAAAKEFTAILLQEAGNAALRWLADGGVYLAGGVPPKMLSWLRRAGALDAFLANPAMAPLLRTIPLQVVTNERTAVLGAIAAGRAGLIPPSP